MGANFCPHCGTAATPGGAFCASCGKALQRAPPPLAPYAGHGGAGGTATTYAAGSGGAVATAPPYALPPATMPVKPPVTQGAAVAGLLLNVLVWPGLGSLVAGQNIGWAQGFLFLFGIPLSLVLIGIPMLVGAWVWGIITGVQLLQRSSPS